MEDIVHISRMSVCLCACVAFVSSTKKYSSCVTFQCWSFLTLFLNYQKLCCLHFSRFFSSFLLGCVCVCVFLANANLSIHETLERSRKTLHTHHILSNGKTKRNISGEKNEWFAPFIYSLKILWNFFSPSLSHLYLLWPPIFHTIFSSPIRTNFLVRIQQLNY